MGESNNPYALPSIIRSHKERMVDESDKQMNDYLDRVSRVSMTDRINEIRNEFHWNDYAWGFLTAVFIVLAALIIYS